MRTNVLNKKTIAKRIAMLESIKMSRVIVEDETTFVPFVTSSSKDPLLN